MSLTVVVTYLPEHLFSIPFCLERLGAQTYTDFEVVLVGRDCPELHPVIQKMARHFTFSYCPCETLSLNAMRNLGAQKAKYDRVLFLSSLLLLHTRGLDIFQTHMRTDRGLFFGVFGQSPRNSSVSQWYSTLKVYYISYLIQGYGRTELELVPDLFTHPHWFFEAQFFAVNKDVFFRLKGFSQSLNDADGAYDFAYRAVQQGFSMTLLLNAWAETLVYKEIMPLTIRLEKHRFKLPAEDPTPIPKLKVQSQSHDTRDWLGRLFSHYLQHDRRIPAHYKQKLMQKETLFDMGDNPHVKQFKAFHIQRRDSEKPVFLIIGVQKAGTTTLFHNLAFHPRLNPAISKELNFFDTDQNFERGEEVYLDYFHFEPDSLAYEASPSYFTTPVCAERIARFKPDIRLIVILRDPVERAYSAWNMFHHPSLTLREYGFVDPRSFEEAIQEELAGEQRFKYLYKSTYSLHLAHYLNVFSRAQILVLDFEQLVVFPKQTLYRCFDFLNIPQHDYAHIHLFPHNQGKYQGQMKPETRKQLQKYFHPFNLELKHKFQLNFSWL